MDLTDEADRANTPKLHHCAPKLRALSKIFTFKKVRKYSKTSHVFSLSLGSRGLQCGSPELIQRVKYECSREFIFSFFTSVEPLKKKICHTWPRLTYDHAVAYSASRKLALPFLVSRFSPAVGIVEKFEQKPRPSAITPKPNERGLTIPWLRVRNTQSVVINASDIQKKSRCAKETRGRGMKTF